jgi:SAM-dependent methyltransferase
VCRASVLAVPFPAAAFDVVATFDVLYHRAVPDDDRALRELARVLRPGGWLLARVPAHNHLRGAHDLQVHTRHRYAHAELRGKVEAAGLGVRRLTYAGLLLMPPALVRRGLQRRAVATAQAHSDVTLPAPPVNAALCTLLAWERWWLPRRDLPVGLSLIVLARKPLGP